MTKNPLTTTHPQIAKDWDLAKNNSLLPDQADSYSKVRIWWRCPEGHAYQVSVHSRVRSGGCKVCQRSYHAAKQRITKLNKSKSLASAQPQLMAEWDYERNKELSPDTISHKSNKLLWWKCQHGHSWQSTPKSRSRGDGCPQCYKINRGEIVRHSKLKKSGIPLSAAYPNLLAEWDYDNNSILPEKVSPKSGLKVSWVCKFGHKWKATIVNRTHAGSNCPMCNPQSSRLEIFLLCELRSIFDQVIWRRRFDGYECDIYIPELNLGIEVDGEYWHRDKNHRERQKSHVLSKIGIQLIRVRDSKLPPIGDHIVWYDKGETPLRTAIRLFTEITISSPNQKLMDYILTGKQKNQREYQKIISRLPAPPSGETLEDLYPIVASEWDYEANSPLTPSLFTASSNAKLAWVCTKGHHWYASINNRTRRKSGCPLCYESERSAIASRGRTRNTISLAQGSPSYLSKFDKKMNVLPPTRIALKSNMMVWWKCENGHSFQKSPNEMVKHHACPGCNSLPFSYPKVAEQWDTEKNGHNKPEDYSWGSGKKVWWKCSNGHNWEAVIVQRTKASHGCPQCYKEQRADINRVISVKKKGSLADDNPAYLAEWDYEKNTAISPDSVTKGSKRKAWWICSKHHSYIQSLESKAHGSICPECAKSKRAESARLARLARTGSLADNHPDIAKQWDQNKNGDLSPNDISSGSKKIVWWRCENGHKWQESITTRTDKRRPEGCPSCRKIGTKTIFSEQGTGQAIVLSLHQAPGEFFG